MKNCTIQISSAVRIPNGPAALSNATETSPLRIRIKTVQVDLWVQPGNTYLLQTSTDLVTWTPNGPPFVATAPLISQDFEVINGPRYFRLMEAP